MGIEVSTWRVRQVPWDAPEGQSLRTAQRRELDQRYGGGDHEPGIAPSANDILAFFIALDATGDARACGGLRTVPASALGAGVMEVKRMYAAPDARGKGAAAAILRAIEAHAKDSGAARLVLETGTSQPDASRFYEKHGFRRIPLFGDYIGSQVSICYGLDLD